jgi:large subunit ribosomal protein L21
MKAVININGSQYLVTEGQEIVVNHLGDTNPTTFSQVLLTISDTGVKVGTPYLPDISIQAEKVVDFKGDKVRTLKYKAKSRYRKVTGFRPQLTKLKIAAIGEKKS